MSREIRLAAKPSAGVPQLMRKKARPFEYFELEN